MDEQANDSSGGPLGEGSQRQPYRTPKLERLGTLTELTAAIATSGAKNDMAGHSPFNKSQ